MVLIDQPPGDATARREAEIPVTEDWEARGATKSTLRHTLPVRFECLKWLQLNLTRLNLIHLLMARGLSAVTPITLETFNIQHVYRDSKEKDRKLQKSHLATLSCKALQGSLQGENLLSVEGEVHGEEDDDEVLALQLSLQVEHPD